MINNKTILITGGTGSFGKKIISTILKKFRPKKLIIFSRDELKQYEMRCNYSENKFQCLRYFLGDVRDYNRIRNAFKNVDIVIHAAALKQVPAAEYNPFEFVKTNILGAQNVIQASIDCDVKKVIALSTDKATAPINLYGATKLTSDKLFIAGNQISGEHGTKFSVVRYGNVMGSRGSVIPFFLEQQKNGFLEITDDRMTRFNITLEESVNFVLKCLENMWGGEMFIPKIPSYRIVDVATAVNPNCQKKIIGIRPGEKLHEEMIAETDAFNTIEFTDYFIILPTAKPSWSIEKFIEESDKSTGKRVKDGFSYNSEKNKHFLSVEELRKLINCHVK